MRQIVESGFVGVNLFFVLSGFILTWNYLDVRAPERLGTRRRFVIARLARIYPVYVVGLLVSAPFFIIGVLRINPDAPWPIAAILTPLLLQAWAAPLIMWNVPGWSLSCEAFFYFVFRVVGERLPRFGRPHLFAALILLYAASLVAPIIYHLAAPSAEGWFRTDDTAEMIMFNPLLRLPEFLAGVCLGLLRLENMSAPSRRAGPRPYAVVIAVTIAIIIALSQSRSFPFVAWHNGAMDPLFWVLIYYLSFVDAPRNATVERWLVVLGEASYALYILHAALWGWWLLALERAPWASSFPTAAYLAYIGLAVGSSVLTLKLIETPMRRWITRRYSGQPVVAD